MATGDGPSGSLIRRSRPVVTGALAALACTLILGSLPVASVTARPGKPDPIADQLRSNSTQLSQTRERLSAATARVENASQELRIIRAQLPAAKSAYARALSSLSAARAAERRASRAVTRTTAQIRRLQERIGTTEEQIDATEVRVGDLARTLYIAGPLSAVDVVLAASNPGDFTVRLAAVQSYAESQNQALAELTVLRSQLAQSKAEATSLRDEMVQLREEARSTLRNRQRAAAQAESARIRVVALNNRQARALRSAEEDRDTVRRRYEQLRLEQARLEQLARDTGDEGGKDEPEEGLSWPIPGATVTSDTGLRRHPIFGYVTCHAGVDFSASTGTPIRSAGDGVIASSTYLNGYGNTIIVSHGGGLTTLYAHMSRTAGSAGEKVSRGDVIGYVGSTGWSTGPHLHWEIRSKGDAYDPLAWMKGTRTRVNC